MCFKQFRINQKNAIRFSSYKKHLFICLPLKYIENTVEATPNANPSRTTKVLCADRHYLLKISHSIRPDVGCPVLCDSTTLTVFYRPAYLHRLDRHHLHYSEFSLAADTICQRHLNIRLMLFASLF